jgi:hypothetical protein
MRRTRTLATLVLCALLAAGCSAIGFAYNNAPSYIAGELEDAFDLDEAQRSELDIRMDKFFAWHRQQELERYHRLLDDAARNAADGITAEEFLEFIDGLRLAFRRLMEQAIVDFSDLGLTLTPEQIDHFDRYFREDSAEYYQYLEMSEQQREIFRVERAIGRMEKWFGSFDQEQLLRLRPRLRQLPEFYEAWISYREERQQALLSALREAPQAGLTHQQLRSILLDPDTDYARAFIKERDAYWQVYAKIIEDISGWLSKVQMEKAIKRLQKYSIAFEGLANRDQY